MENPEIKSREICFVQIEEIKPRPDNRNTHNDSQISQLAKIIQFQGFRSPLIISNQSGLLVSGHGRLLAAKKLGLKKLPVIYQDFDSLDQEYIAMVSENAIALQAELDLSGINSDIGNLGPFDIDLLGIKNFVVEVADKEGECDEDEIPEHVEPRTKLGDIYRLGNHRLMCGSATMIDQVEKLMDGNEVDLVMTDPPYGISVVKNNQVGGAAATKFGGKVGAVVKSSTYKPIENDETTDAARESYQVCMAIGAKAVILWGGNYFTDFLPPSPCWLVWDKQNTGNFADVELAWCSKESGAKLYSWMWNGMARKGERKDELATRVHPTQKPVGLSVMVLKDFEGHNVLDLFGGSGSTLIACEKTNRKCFMMELDPKYCDVIVARWMKFTGKMAHRVLEDGTEEPYGEV